MVPKIKMKCLFVRVLLLLVSANIIFCSPTCCLNNRSSTQEIKRVDRKTFPREVDSPKYKLTNALSIDPNEKHYENEVTKSGDQKPLDIHIPLDLKKEELKNRTISVEGSFDVEENCTDCLNDTLGSKHSHKHIGCECALFTTYYPTDSDVPLTTKTFPNVSCHNMAKEDACTKACLSLAVLHYNVRDMMICSQVQNSTKLTAYLHTKVCDEGNQWTFTGLTTNKPICCKKGEVIQC